MSPPPQTSIMGVETWAQMMAMRAMTPEDKSNDTSCPQLSRQDNLTNFGKPSATFPDVDIVPRTLLSRQDNLANIGKPSDVFTGEDEYSSDMDFSEQLRQDSTHRQFTIRRYSDDDDLGEPGFDMAAPKWK